MKAAGRSVRLATRRRHPVTQSPMPHRQNSAGRQHIAEDAALRDELARVRGWTAPARQPDDVDHGQGDRQERAQSKYARVNANSAS